MLMPERFKTPNIQEVCENMEKEFSKSIKLNITGVGNLGIYNGYGKRLFITPVWLMMHNSIPDLKTTIKAAK